MKTHAFAKRISSLLVAVSLILTLMPQESRAFPLNGEVINMIMRIESAESLVKEVSASLRGLRCTGANAEKVRSARALLKSAQTSMKAGKYGTAITELQQARTIVGTIPRTASKARHLRLFNSKTKIIIALCAVVITGSVLASRAEANEGETGPREMAEQTRDSIPSYFDLIESSGCSD